MQPVITPVKTKALNFSITAPLPPTSTFTDWSDALEKQTKYSKAILINVDGVPTVQAIVGYKHQRQITAVRKYFSGSQVVVLGNALKAWNDFVVPEVLVEGPLTTGFPPLPRTKNGDAMRRNLLIKEKGIEASLDEGIIDL